MLTYRNHNVRSTELCTYKTIYKKGLKSRPSRPIKQRRRPIIMYCDLVGSKKTVLGLKSRPMIKQRRRPIILFRDLVGSKKKHNVRPYK